MGDSLSFRNVSKVYVPAQGRGAGFHALRDVSCRVPAGRRVAIIGRSGSGKSTFLHLAAGIDVPTSGSVLFGEEDLASMTEARRTQVRRDSIGLIFQFFHLLPHLTVQENVLLPEWIAGGDGGGRAVELLRRVDLADRAGEPVARLSGGEQQRVAICRALLRRPRLLLADEPTGNLDDETGRTVMDLLLQLAEEEGSTLIYVTHDLDLAGRADEIWRIHSGVLETV